MNAFDSLFRLSFPFIVRSPENGSSWGLKYFEKYFAFLNSFHQKVKRFIQDMNGSTIELSDTKSLPYLIK